MTNSFTATEQTFWIAHSDGALEHGILNPGTRIDTGQAYLETYTSARAWSLRIAALRKDYVSAVAAWRETLRLRDPFAMLTFAWVSQAIKARVSFISCFQ